MDAELLANASIRREWGFSVIGDAETGDEGDPFGSRLNI
jgi:hypothetical protein